MHKAEPDPVFAAFTTGGSVADPSSHFNCFQLKLSRVNVILTRPLYFLNLRLKLKKKIYSKISPFC